MRTILLSCLLLALLSNYTPYAQEGRSATLPDEPTPAGDAAASTDPNGATEDLVTPEVEAPEALFELDIGDADVDFFLEGTWRASVFGSFGVLIGPEGTQLSPFPGLDTGQVFQQMPDLTFSAWLLNRFFIEASVIGDFIEKDYNYFDQNYILMGYLGAEEEFLKRILIGSKDVSIDPFPFIDVPEPGLSSLGVEAVMGTGMSEHQLLLRYDNNAPDNLTYIGSNLVSEQVIALDEYIRGRFFKLPDENVDNLEVYIQDDFGLYSGDDGNNYRKADADDAVLASEEGTVFLKEAAEGSVLVFYTVNGDDIGASSSNGREALPRDDGGKIDPTTSNREDFYWGNPSLVNYFDQGAGGIDERQVTINSDICLRLFKPDEFSPFEIFASYEIDEPVPAELSKIRVTIVQKGNRNDERTPANRPVKFRLLPGAEYITGYVDADLRGDLRNLYPFLDLYESPAPTIIYDPENLIYGPLADAKPGYLNYEILLSELTPVSAYQIGSDVVPGSVQILRNGITETRFEVDYELGTITFLTEIAEDDRLVVSFRRKESLVNNGDILFAWGNTLTFGEALTLQLATGVRWNFLPGTFTDETYSRTGSVMVSAGITGETGPLRYEASIGGAYTNPDTTGILRLVSMEREVVEPDGSPYYIDTSAEFVGSSGVEAKMVLDSKLVATYPIVGNFHPFGEEQRVLKVEWDTPTSDGAQWTLQGHTDTDNEDIGYRNIVFYYLLSPDTTTNLNSKLEFELLDLNGRGVRWMLPAEANETDQWREITVALEEENVYKDDNPVANSSVTKDPYYDSFTRFTVKMTEINAADDPGTLYLDELHLTDPRGALGAAATLDLELLLPGTLIEVGDYAVVHDLALRESASFSSRGFSTLYGRPAQSQSIQSVTELDLGLAFSDLGIDIDVATNDAAASLAAGHDVTVPNFPFPIVFSEAFRISGPTTDPLTITEFPQFSRDQTEIQRANTLSLSVLPLGQLDLAAAAGSIEKVLSQSWEVDLALTPGPVTLQNDLSISGSVNDFVVPRAGYFSNWIYGYALLVPYGTLAEIDSATWKELDELERQADLSLDWSLDTAPVGLQTLWRHGFHSYDFVASEATLQSLADLELNVPFRWQNRGITVFSITPGYRRNLDVINLESGLLDYSDDFSRSFETIYNQQYLYGQFPFVELYSTEAEQLFIDLSRSYDLDKADYRAEAYIQLSRRFSSRIRDLFLPSFFELSVKKQFVKDGDLTDLYNTYTLTAQSTALNLFGDFGAYPLFPFYRTDEFSTSLSVSIDVDENTEYPDKAQFGEWLIARHFENTETVELILDHFFSFAGQRDTTLTFENRFNLLYDWEADEVFDKYGTRLGWSDSVKFLYLWFRYPQTGLRLPLLPENVGQQGYWSHQESLVLELNGPNEESSYHPFNLILSHESTAMLPDYGEISAEISAGIDVEKTDGGQRYWRLGLSGGISVQIEF